jgi:hypothetical protein
MVAPKLFVAALVFLTACHAKGDDQPKEKPAPRSESIRVISRDKEKETGRASDFLRPPGSVGRYDEGPIDWRDVPPWRQTSFFGVRARGQFFVYVVDCSGSMIDEDRLARAKEELRRSVLSLREPQRFKVIFYNDEPIAMPGELARNADLASKAQLLSWLRLIEPDGATDPRPALGLALSLRPDAVFLLSDGEFPEGTAEGVSRKNPRKVPIHCIDLSAGEAGDQLERIARESGGQYAKRPWAGP